MASLANAKLVNPLVAAAKDIDRISLAAMEAFASPESFEKELAVASAVNELRTALTPEVMKEVMALMNTTIGFDTDRNPKKAKAGDNITPYDVETIRDVFIESRLRGFHIIGREFTVISGNFYAGVNGLERLVKTHKKISNYRDNFDVPRVIAGGEGALVKCKAEWLQESVPQTLEREFAIRVNKGQGADAILGKAKRKLLAVVYSRLSGVVTPEGEIGDDVAPVAQTTLKVEAPKAESLFVPAAVAPAPAPAPAPADDIPMTGPTPLAAKQPELTEQPPQPAKPAKR